MKFILLFLLLINYLNASKVLSYNIYERSNRVDIMITFDTPYEGTIRQKSSDNRILIKLSDANIESAKSKRINSSFISALSITPVSSGAQIVASVPQGIKLSVSKTSDAYGLRLRFQNSVVGSKKNTPAESKLGLSGIETKEEMQLDNNYIIIVSLLFILLIVLVLIKRKIASATDSPTPWLFSKKSSTPQEAVNLKYQKAIDQKNRVVLLEYGEESYLVLVGNSNILLDKFRGNTPKNENEFNTILKDKHQELDEFMRLDTTDHEVLDSYKQKASGEFDFIK